ncbi:YjbQ family protein [Candidatus Saccharibacteria bacterium]|nr:YjbQ family protein [Candidatus Saccharibacteria bacterium]
MELTIHTDRERQVIDITDEVQKLVSSDNSSVTVFAAHTTCAVTTADLDPGAGEDLAAAIWEMVPKLDYSRHHNPAHMPAHIASSVVGPSVIIPVRTGKLVLGTWQRVILIELDGPRERKLVVSVL